MNFRLRKSDLIFVALALGVVLFLAFLPSPRDNNPPVPNDLAHHGIKLERDCLGCHVQGGKRPMQARHPKRQDCFRCHRERV
jgi:hypothetical protein